MRSLLLILSLVILATSCNKDNMQEVKELTKKQLCKQLPSLYKQTELELIGVHVYPTVGDYFYNIKKAELVDGNIIATGTAGLDFLALNLKIEQYESGGFFALETIESNVRKYNSVELKGDSLSLTQKQGSNVIVYRYLKQG